MSPDIDRPGDGPCGGTSPYSHGKVGRYCNLARCAPEGKAQVKRQVDDGWMSRDAMTGPREGGQRVKAPDIFPFSSVQISI